MEFGTVKAIHTTAASLSIALFLLRGAWLAWSPAMLRVTWVRIVPHVVDTLLLGVGVWLAVHLPAGSPHAWLAAKLVALVVYIALGMIALKRAKTPGLRAAAFAAALGTFAYIVTVAVTRSPRGFLAWL